MATYAEIQEYLRRKHGRTFKPCWIAHVKAMHGLTTRRAWNRASPDKRKHPCPDWAWPLIEEAFRHFGMIP